MKAITVIQPWAILLASGKKHCETRSWKTNYRGEILIHAGMAKYNYFIDVCRCKKELVPYFRNAGIGSDADLQRLPFKAIIGRAVLVNCVQIDALTAELIKKQHPDEYAFGNFTPGRYAWVMEEAMLFDEPIPASGKQGLWNWDAEIIFHKHANAGATERIPGDMAGILGVQIEPRKTTDRGGYLAMPLRKNVPEPGNSTWKLQKCPECGRECWERPLPASFGKAHFDGALCTECALRKGLQEKI